MKPIRTCAILCACLLFVTTIAGQRPPETRVDFDSATDAWARGDYPAALNGYIGLLQQSDGSTYLDRIAVQTGEIYRTLEITADGLNPEFSPDGRLVAYESGSGPARTTRVVDPAAGMKEVARLGGFNAAFSPSGDRLVYMRLQKSDELSRAQADAAKAGAPGGGRGGAQQMVTWLQMKYVDLVLRDLSAGREQVLTTDGLLKSSPGLLARRPGDLLRRCEGKRPDAQRRLPDPDWRRFGAGRHPGRRLQVRARRRAEGEVPGLFDSLEQPVPGSRRAGRPADFRSTPRRRRPWGWRGPRTRGRPGSVELVCRDRPGVGLVHDDHRDRADHRRRRIDRRVPHTHR